MSAKTPRIAILTTGSGTPAPITNALAAAFDDHCAFIEPPEPKSTFLKRRAKKIGWLATAHQFPVMVLGKFAKKAAAARYMQIEADHSVSFQLAHNVKTKAVPSGNDAAFIDAVTRFKPDIVVLLGSRLLSKKTLAAISCPVINFHAGYNPKYRGLNGGYWAIANGDVEHYGTTVHYVDAGVDTGEIIAQQKCKPTKSDTLLTHQHNLTAQSTTMMVETVRAILAGQAKTYTSNLPSKQWFHPTLTGYLWRGVCGKGW